MSEQGRTIAIIAHITFIGWIIAIIMNNNEKDEFASFYIRQVLGIFIIGAIGGLIPIVNLLVALIVLIAIIMSLIGAVNRTKTLIPGVGPLFQDWFKSI